MSGNSHRFCQTIFFVPLNYYLVYLCATGRVPGLSCSPF